ncbi:MAG TPA: YtxH domain-containing protein [Terriglobia bacterium]
MSRKVRQHKENMEDRNMETMSTEDIGQTTKETLDTVVGKLNDNKLLIGIIGVIAAAGCGAAYYLFATESGKRLRNDIQDKSLDMYDLISEQAANTVERLRGVAQDMMSDKQIGPESGNIRKVA